MGASNKSRRKRINELEKQAEINCGRCPPNRGENTKRKPRSDRYKDKRKGK